MKKIGYIYKYSPSEGMGILVYGSWKERNWYKLKLKDFPILFSDNDLISEVKTGQLVYFDFDGKTASNIERASLSNFRVEFVTDLIRGKKNESDSFYRDNTIILFECLDNIIYSNSNENENNQKQIGSSGKVNYEIDYIDDYGNVEIPGVDDYNAEVNNIENPVFNNPNIQFHESVIELYNSFGKSKRKYQDSVSLDIFDLSLWVDSEVLNQDYYGMKVDELLFLYDIFVLRKHYNSKGAEIKIVMDNDSISPEWSLLLSKFKEDEIRDIIHKAPKLQPALPVDFCKRNTDVLTDKYGMPNVEICELYCLHKILNADTCSDYIDINNKLHNYSNCTATHLEREGTPMCKIGEPRIQYLKSCLEEKYEKNIKPNVLLQVEQLSQNAGIVDLLRNATQDGLINVGIFIDRLNNLRDNFWGYEVVEKVLESYEKLSLPFQDALKAFFLDYANKSAILSIQSEGLNPFSLSYCIEQLGDWILESTKQQIKEMVNNKFSRLSDPIDLLRAYNAGYITGMQCYYGFKNISSNFNESQLQDLLSDCYIYDPPLVVQWYIVSNIIKQCGYESLDDYVDGNIRGILYWLNTYANLNDIVYKKAEELVCSVLSNNERWELFEEKRVQSPGIENIRKYLVKAFKKNKKNKKNKELFNLKCFQDGMISEVNSITDPEFKMFIVDNLDTEHQYLMQQKVTGFWKLYLWQKNPSNNCDWNLIRLYFHKLPANAQIRILRYVFGKLSSGDFHLTLENIYSEFVETTTPACSAICGILFILIEKKKNIDVSITPAMLEKIIGHDEQERLNFLKDVKEFFYPCNGYCAISAIQQPVEYQFFNGIITKEKINNELYYVVQFYDIPVDLNGRPFDFLDSKFPDNAKQILLRNFCVKVINGKYYIHESQEFLIKQFVISKNIDDKCGLVSNKQSLLDLGYLPRKNMYQPLYTNRIKNYEDSDYYICRDGCIGGSDSDSNNSIPFFWCNKKMCVRRAHFFLPPSLWDCYHFSDLLFISMGQTSEIREIVQKVNGEISQFICDYKKVCSSDERNIYSKPLNEYEERGIWDETSSTYRDIDDEEYYESDDEYYER